MMERGARGIRPRSTSCSTQTWTASPLRRAILHDRHVKWLPQIEAMLNDGRTHVVIVGAAHMVGPDSVVAMLRAKGIRRRRTLTRCLEA